MNPIFAQGFETFKPTATNDTSQVKSDSAKLLSKSKIVPAIVDQAYFMQVSRYKGKVSDSAKSFSNTSFLPNYVSISKNPQDTLLYPVMEIDSNEININNYRTPARNLGSYQTLQQFNLGEPGSPLYSGYHNPRYSPNSFVFNKSIPMIQIGCNPFGNQICSAEDMPFHRAFAPFTEFNYLQGPGKTIALNALHTQNFSPHWNVTLDYRSIINQEQYTGSSQNNTFRNIKLGSLYLSSNNRYKQIIALSWNRSTRDENGGLKTDSLFFIPQNSDRFKLKTLGFYDPKLTTASSRYRQIEHLFSHKYYLQKGFAVYQSIAVQRVVFEYKDTKRDTNYYGKQSYNFGNKTADSNVWNAVNHKSGVEYQFPSNRGTMLSNSMGLEHNIQTQSYLSNQTNFNTDYRPLLNSQSVRVYNNSNKKLIPSLSAQFVYSGYGKSGKNIQAKMPLLQRTRFHKSYTENNNNDTHDLIINGVHNAHDEEKNHSPQKALPWELTKIKYFTTVKLAASNFLQPITLFQNAFYANHFQYQRNLLLTGEKNVSVNLNHISLQKPSANNTGTANENSRSFQSVISLTTGQWINPTLSIDSVSPTQLKTTKFNSVHALFTIKGKKLNISQLIQYKQYKDVQLNKLFNYGMPLFQTNTSLQYTTPAFHKAMKLTLGMNIQYTSKFQTTHYRADAATFIIDSKSTESGNYFELDFFALARVQTVDVFVKAEHINELFIIPGFNTKYQYIAGYPIQPYRIQFGLNWKFFN